MILCRSTCVAAFCLTFVVAVASVTVADEAAVLEETFAPLFDGQSLDGWVRRGGEATYRVEADAEGGAQIVGTSKKGTSNTFLCTDRDYADFVLEFDVKVDPALNSGVQFRSNVMAEPTAFEKTISSGEITQQTTPAGTIFGYQAEIDPSDRGWSGGVYDEGRRGWIYNLEGDQHSAARAAFKPTEWNHYRIEAVGDSIKTFINGTPVADFSDDMTATGFIGLQVHAIYDDAHVGKEVRWRNVRISER